MSPTGTRKTQHVNFVHFHCSEKDAERGYKPIRYPVNEVSGQSKQTRLQKLDPVSFNLYFCT